MDMFPWVLMDPLFVLYPYWWLKRFAYMQAPFWHLPSWGIYALPREPLWSSQGTFFVSHLVCQVGRWTQLDIKLNYHVIKGVTPSWSWQGLQLDKLKLWLPLEGHVILPHFKNVNILINIVWEVYFWKPTLTKDDKFTFEIKYFSNYENPFVLCHCVFSIWQNLGGVPIGFVFFFSKSSVSSSPYWSPYFRVQFDSYEIVQSPH